LEDIKVIFYIEALSNDKKLLERAIEDTVKKLKAEQGVVVENLLVGDVLEDDEEELLKYSGMIEATLKGPLDKITLLAVRYAPAVVEVVSPGKIEIDSESLMKILGEVAYIMGQLMEKFGGLAVYPDLKDVPEPEIGYSREEIESFIIGEREILYRFVIEVFDKSEEAARVNMSKALSLEGCRINKLVVQKGDKENKWLLAAEVLSDFETLVQLMAKYVPVAISIMEPEVIDITAGELQNALTDIAGFAHELIVRPLKSQLIEKANTQFKLNP